MTTTGHSHGYRGFYGQAYLALGRRSTPHLPRLTSALHIAAPGGGVAARLIPMIEEDVPAGFVAWWLQQILECVMAEIRSRDLHLVKKSLCLSIATIEAQAEGPFGPDSDMTDMKDLAERLMDNDTELAHYIRSARLILNGGP